MIRLLENLLRVDEDSAGLKSLYRIYRDQEKGLDPDSSDLFVALSMMKKYYKDYLNWYSDYTDIERYKKELPVIQDYQKRLQEIQQAIRSRDVRKQMIVLDTAVNQWHIDYPVIAHLGMETEEDELEDLSDKIAEILDRLGRLPKESPYAGMYREHKSL